MKTALALIRGDREVHFVRHVNDAADDPELTRAVEYSDLVYKMGNDNVEISLGSTGEKLEDVAYTYHVRDFYHYNHERYAVARYLSAKNCTVYNSDLAASEAISKLEQIMTWQLAGLPTPQTYFCNHVELLQELPAYPLVAKSITGSGGDLNFLVNSRAELEEALQKAGKAIVQVFIPNDSDYRVIMMYGEPVVAYRRLRSQRSSSHLNNVQQGAKREMTEDSEVIDLAVKAAAALKREFCGMDIVRDKKNSQLYLLESNFSAGMHSLNDGIDELYFETAVSMIKNHSQTGQKAID